MDHVAGFCICNDVSERSFQMERGGQWMKGKGCATFGPLGPWLVTPDEIADVQALDMWLDVNGRRMQTGSTATMIFNVVQIVSYTSHFMVLEPGDVDHHRHAARRRPRHEARDLPARRRRDEPRHRGPRRAEADGRALAQDVTSPARPVR